MGDVFAMPSYRITPVMLDWRYHIVEGDMDYAGGRWLHSSRGEFKINFPLEIASNKIEDHRRTEAFAAGLTNQRSVALRPAHDETRVTGLALFEYPFNAHMPGRA